MPLLIAAPGFAARRGLLFDGSFHGDATPDADALLWFVREVLPLLPPEIAMQMVGAVQAPAVRQLAGPRVILRGRVDNLRPVYDAARVLVAPGRYGADVPLKVIEAAAAGVPLVLTPLLAGQLGWTDGVEAVVGGTPQILANAVCRLHDDRMRWERLQVGALVAVQRDHSREHFAIALGRAIENA